MTIKLNTNLVPLFSGTYESIWEVCETDDNGDELEVEYDFKDLLKSIAEVYHQNEKYILSELNCPFIKEIKFDGGFYSPREYNFKTDELDFTIEADKNEILEKLDSLKENPKFAEFLKEHYTSYDGFISFTPNNFSELREQIVNEGDEFTQSIGALIRFVTGEADCPNCLFQEIEEAIHEDWQGNGYGGLDYESHPYEV